MNRLKQYFARGRTMLLTALVVVLGPPFLLLFVLTAGLVTETHVEINAAWMLVAVAAVILAAAAFHLVRYWTLPRQTVNIGYELKLTQPMTPLGHYSFFLRVFYDCEERGQSRTAQQAAIEMRFKAKDHPDLLAWCTSQVAAQLEQHRENAGRLYPEAHITLSPGPTHEALTESTDRSH